MHLIVVVVVVVVDTSDVQSVCGFLEGTKVTVLCLFAEGSVASGCMISLITDTTNITTELTRDPSSGSATGKITVNTPSVLNNGYHLYAQDIDADGSVSPLQLSGNLSMELAACNYLQHTSGTSVLTIQVMGSYLFRRTA